MFCGSFYAAAVLSSCDGEHVAPQSPLHSPPAQKASQQSSALAEHTRVLVNYNSKRPLPTSYNFHQSSEEAKITPPGGQEGRLPGGSGQDVEAKRMERSSPGFRAPQCPLSSCTAPHPYTPPPPHAFLLHLTPEEGAGKRFVFESSLISPNSQSLIGVLPFLPRTVGRITLVSTRPFPKFLFPRP